MANSPGTIVPVSLLRQSAGFLQKAGENSRQSGGKSLWPQKSNQTGVACQSC